MKEKVMNKNEIKTVKELIDTACVLYAELPFVRYMEEGREIIHSYKTLEQDVKAFSAWLMEQKISDTDRMIHVAISGKNSYWYVVTLLGTMYAGGVAVPMDPQLSVEKLKDQILRADVDVVVFDTEQQAKIEQLEQADLPLLYVGMKSELARLSMEKIVKDYVGKSAKVCLTEQQPAMIIFTSGTTGLSKGVVLSQGNMIDNTFCTIEKESITGAAYLNILPMHHIFCINGDIFMVVRYGCTLCICDETSKLFWALEQYQPTSVRLVPMMAKAILRKYRMLRTQNPELSEKACKEQVMGRNLSRISSGGGYLAPEISQAFAELGITIGQGYGMSECAPKISSPDYDRPDKRPSVGKLVDGCQVKIRDGEILVKSPSVMLGYYKDPERTKEALTEDGWLCTGDIGYLDEEGYLYLTGRKKNLIILSNGENVSPEEIECKFDDDMLIAEILVYGHEEQVVAAVYPSEEYVKKMQITNVEEEVQKRIRAVNENLPSYARIMNVTIEKQPFDKTASKKIIRENYLKKQKESKFTVCHKQPENPLQQQIFDLFAQALGTTDFGIDTNVYECGLDSFGSVLFMEELHDQMHKELTWDALLEYNTVEKLAAYLEKDIQKDIDFS